MHGVRAALAAENVGEVAAGTCAVGLSGRASRLCLGCRMRAAAALVVASTAAWVAALVAAIVAETPVAAAEAAPVLVPNLATLPVVPPPEETTPSAAARPAQPAGVCYLPRSAGRKSQSTF